MVLLADESFQRWLANTASEAEAQHWRAWLEEAPARPEILAEAKALWRAAQFQAEPLPEVETEWLRLQSRLNLAGKKPAVIRRLDASRAEVGRDRNARFSWKYLGVFAAAAGIGLAVLWPKEFASEQNQTATLQTVTTAYGERAHLKLPDGTTVVLNAQSTLRYPDSWREAAARRVELRGEAYFEAASHMLPHAETPQPFVVQTGDGEVTVVGTKFVVYERNAGTRVVVEEGRVQVKAAAISAAPVLLSAGQLARFRRSEERITPENAGLGFYTTWWQEEWRLEATPFAEVIQRLEETYGVRVEVLDEPLRRRKLSGAVENRDLDGIIVALAKALRINVRREGEVVKFGEDVQ